jgi:hypothetical protein
MDIPVRGPRDRASRFDAGVVVFAAATTGLLFVAMLPEAVRILTGLRGGAGGLAYFFYNALFGVWFVQLLRRVIHRDFAWSPGWPFAANALDSLARGWLIALAAGDARLLGDALAHFGAPSPNGSYAADAFFFLLVTLMLATPGLAALWLARRVA